MRSQFQQREMRSQPHELNCPGWAQGLVRKLALADAQRQSHGKFGMEGVCSLQLQLSSYPKGSTGLSWGVGFRVSNAWQAVVLRGWVFLDPRDATPTG